MRRKEVITIESLEMPKSFNMFGFDPINVYAVFIPLIGFPMLFSAMDMPIPVIILSGVIGGSIALGLVFATPSHLNVIQTVRTWRYYLKQPKEIRHCEAAAAEANDSVVKYIQAEESTSDFLGIDRYYPKRGVIQHTSGSYLAAVKLNPPNLDFSDGEMEKIARHVGDFFNEQMHKKEIQFFVTTEPFDIRGYISNLEKRREDPDVQDKPIAQALLDEQIQVRPERLRKTGTQEATFYLIVEVKKGRISSSNVKEQTPAERLTNIPWLGVLIEVVMNVSDDSSDLEQHAEHLEEVTRRANKVQTGMTAGLEDYSAQRVGLGEWVYLLQRFSRGRQPGTKAEIRQQAVQTATFDDGSGITPPEEGRDTDSDESVVGDVNTGGEDGESDSDGPANDSGSQTSEVA